MYRIGCFAAIRIYPLAFPFIFRFGDENPVRRQCPWILHSSDVDTLGFTVYPSFLPAAPYHIALAIMFKGAGMDCPVVVFICLYASFHHKCSFHGVGGFILDNINLVIIHIAVVCGKVNIPFVIYTMNFGCPQMIGVAGVGGYPYIFLSSMWEVCYIIGFPKYDSVFWALCIIIFAFMKNSPWLCSTFK